MAQVRYSAVAAAGTSFIGTPDLSSFSHECIRLSCLACSSQLGQQQQQPNQSREMYYSNILCEECKMGMSSKDRQVEIFGLLINFFEPNRPEKVQQKSNETSSKMKIKDLIRLVMHILNEVSGLSSALYSQFPSLVHSTATKKTFLPFHSQLNHHEQHSEMTANNTFIGFDEKSKLQGSTCHSKSQVNQYFEEVSCCSENNNVDSNLQMITTAPIKDQQPGFDSFENKSLLTRRSNLNGPMLIQPLNESVLDKHFKNVSERRVRTESDEIDEQKQGSLRMASQIRRNSVKTKSLLSTQPSQLKRTTIVEANEAAHSKKLPVYAPTLFEEVNNFFTHPSPSAKLNYSKNSNSILASTQYATGASDFLAQTSQIDIQLDGSFNNEQFSKTVPNPLKEFTDRLFSLPSDTQNEIEIYPRKSSQTQMTKKLSDPFNQTGIISIQKKRNSFVPLVPPSKTSMYPIQDTIKNEGIQKMAGFLKRDAPKGIPARSSSPISHPIQCSQKIEPLRSSSCSRNIIDQKYNTSFRQFHPRSKSSLTAGTQSEFLPSSLIQSRTGSTSFQQAAASSKENPLQIQYQSHSVRITQAQERSIIKALMREQYGEQYNEGNHKCKKQFIYSCEYFKMKF